MKVETKSKYDIEAESFIKATGITIDKVYDGHRKHFDGDTGRRSWWNIMIIAPGRKSFSYGFGQSIQDSYKAVSREGARLMRANCCYADPSCGPLPSSIRETKKAPSDYSLLACISSNSYQSETFEDFCFNFSYDTDSRKALDTYLACEKVASDINRFFTAEEIEILREIM